MKAENCFSFFFYPAAQRSKWPHFGGESICEESTPLSIWGIFFLGSVGNCKGTFVDLPRGKINYNLLVFIQAFFRFRRLGHKITFCKGLNTYFLPFKWFVLKITFAFLIKKGLGFAFRKTHCSEIFEKFVHGWEPSQNNILFLIRCALSIVFWPENLISWPDFWELFF